MNEKPIADLLRLVLESHGIEPEKRAPEVLKHNLAQN